MSLDQPIPARTWLIMSSMPRPIDEGKARDYNVHAADSFAYSVDKSMKAIDNIILEDFHMSQLCPWHTQQVMCTNKHGAGMDPMERYMAEAETEQSAVYRGIREGTLSITKACTCAELLSAAKSSKSKVSSVGHC